MRTVLTASFGLGLLVLFLGLWTRLPAPIYRLLPLSVGAPEVSAWLLVGSIGATTLAALCLFRFPSARFAVAIGIASAIFPLLVFTQVSSTLARFDAAMTEGLGDLHRLAATPDARARQRPSPIITRDLFFGMRVDPVDITRGIVFRTTDGGPLTLDVYRPRTLTAVPIVVQIYGGGWVNGQPGDNPVHAQALAASGYVVIAIDYRHAPTWRWPAQRDDVQAALAWVREYGAQHGGDPRRIALLGRSAGSQLAMLASRQYPGGALLPPIAAIVSYYGPVDLVHAYRNPPVPDPLDVRTIEESLIGGPLDAHREAYADASPITFADKPHPPTLLITAKRDKIVEADASARLHQALRQSGISVHLEIPWADHAFDAVPSGPSGQIALYYTQQFLGWVFAGGQ